MKILKTAFLFTSTIFFSFLCSAQAILTADNNPGAVAVPGAVFTGATALTDAISAAVDDDIIHVVRSSTSYETVTIDKRLNIFGIGLWPDTDGSSRSSVPQIDILDPVASGTRLSGLVINTGVFLGGNPGSLSNLLIENSQVRRIQHASSTTTIDNIIIRNNYMGYGLGTTEEETIDFLLGFVSNIVIANNIIYGSTKTNVSNGAVADEGSVTTDQSTIENNIFVHTNVTVTATGWYAFEDLRNSIVKSNIFYGIGPQAKSVLSVNTFENNLCFSALPNASFSTAGSNTSTNDLTGQDPLFVNLGFGTSIPSLSTVDMNLDTGSPSLGTGANGTDMGVYGGPIPFNLEGTLIPTIQELNVPSMVIEGNNLEVRIKAKGN